MGIKVTPDEWEELTRGYISGPRSDVFRGDENDSVLEDLWTATKRGGLGVIKAGVGLADLASGGAATRAVGGTLDSWDRSLANEYSPEVQNAAYQRAGAIAAADGEVNKGLAALGSTLSNPRLLMTDVTETLLPSAVPIFGAAKAARAVSGVSNLGTVGRAIAGNASREELAAKLVKPVAYTGEGLVGAGMSANQIASENIREGRDPGKGLWAAGAVGLTTGGIAAGMGRLSRWAGKEAELAGAMAGRGVAQAMTKGAKPQTLLGGAAKSFVGEGAEEAAQGAFEQLLPNYALDKPLTEGMGENVAQSALTGGMLGAGMHAAAYPFTPSTEAQPQRQYAIGRSVEDARDALDGPARARIETSAESTPMQGTPAGIPPQGAGTPPPMAMPPQVGQVQPQPAQSQTQPVSDEEITQLMNETDRQHGTPSAEEDIQAAAQQVQSQAAAAEQAKAQVAERKKARAEKRAQAAADEQAVKDASLAFPRSTEPHPAGKRDGTRQMKPLGAQAYNKATFSEKAKVADAMDRANAITRDVKTSKSAFPDVGILASATAKMTEGAKSLDDVKANLEKRATEWLKTGDSTQAKQAVTYRAAYEMLADPSVTDADAKARAEKWVEEHKPKGPEQEMPTKAKGKGTALQDKFFFSYTPSQGVRAEWTKHSKEIGEEDADKLVRAIQTAFSSGKGDSGVRRSKDAKKVIEAATAIVKQFKEHKKIAQGNMADPANGTADKIYQFFNHVSNRDREMLEKVGVTPEELSQIGKVFQTGKIAEDEYEMAPLFELGKPNPTVEQVAEVMRNRLRASGSIYGPDDRIYSKLNAEQRRIHDAAEEQVLSEMDSNDSNIMSEEDANAEMNARVATRGVNKQADGDEEANAAEDAFMRFSNETQETRLERALSDHIKRLIGRAMADVGVMKKSRAGKLEPMQSLRVPVRNPHGVLLYESDKLTGKEVPQTTDIFIPPENAATLIKDQGKTAEVRERLAKEMPDLLARACTVINYAARKLSKGGQIDRLQEVILNTYVAVGELTKVSGLAPDKSKVLRFLLGLENTLMDKGLKTAADKRKAILEQTRPFSDLVITEEKNSEGKAKNGHAAQARREKERERFHQVAVNQARVFLAKGKETLEDEAAANAHLTERQINELFGSNETRDEFISDESVKDSAADKAEAAKLDAATEQADRKMALAKFFGNRSYRKFTDSEANAMSKYHKAYVKSEAGESGKRRVIRGEAALKFADASARIVMRGTFFPRVLKVGEKKKWYQRIQAAVGDFQKTFIGDLLGYRERIPSPMDNAGNMNGFVQKVIGNDKLIYDNPYKGIKRAELRPYVAKLEATRQAIRVEFGAVIARNVPKFLTAYAIGLKKFTGPIADLQKGSRLTALDNYDALVRNFVDAARCSSATKQKVIAYMDEAKALAEKEIKRQEQFYNDPTSRANLPVAPLETGTNEVAPKTVAMEGQKKNPTNPSKEGAVERAPEYRKVQATVEEEINFPNDRISDISFKKMLSSGAISEVKQAAVYVDNGEIDEGVALPLDTAIDTLRRSEYSSKCLEGVFSKDTATILAWSVQQFDKFGIEIPAGILFIDGIESRKAPQQRGSFFGIRANALGASIATLADHPASPMRPIATPGGIIRICRGLPSAMPPALRSKLSKLEEAFAEGFALRAGMHEIFHAINAASGYALSKKFAEVLDTGARAEISLTRFDNNAPKEIYLAYEYANGSAHEAARRGDPDEKIIRVFGSELASELLPAYLTSNKVQQYIDKNCPETANVIKEALHALSGTIRNSSDGDSRLTKTGPSAHSEREPGASNGPSSSPIGQHGVHTDRPLTGMGGRSGRRVGEGSERRSAENSEDLHSEARSRPRRGSAEVSPPVGGTSQVPVSGHGAGGSAIVHSGVGETAGRESAGQGRSPSGTGGRPTGAAVSTKVGNAVLPPQGDRGSSGDGTPVSGPEVTAKNQILERVPEELRPLARTILNKSKSGGLRFMFTRNFVDTFAKMLPSLRTWWANVEHLMQTRAKRQQAAADIAERFQKLSKYEQERVNMLLDDATTLGFWPYRDPQVFPTEDSWNKYVAKMVKQGPEYGQFLKRYAALTTAAKKSVKDVLDYGTEEKVKLAELAKRNIERSMQKQIDAAKGEAQDELKAELEHRKADVDKDLQEALTHPYVPYGRQGSHIVVYRSEKYLRAERALNTYKERLANQGTPPTEEQKKVLSVLEKALDSAETNPNDYVVEFYESELDANKRYYALKKQFPNAPNEAVQMFDKAEYTSQNAPKWAQYQTILNELDKEMEGENGTGSVREGDLRRMTAEVQELFAKSLPSSSGRKSWLRRKGIAGYNPNMMENFVHHARATSHMIASMETSWDINEALADISKEAEARGAFGDRDQATLVANEVRRRQRQIFNPMRGEVSGKVMRVTSMWMLLTNPAFYLQNLLQPFMMSAPYINGRFKGNCLPELMRTMKTVAAFVKQDRTLRNLRETLTDAEYKALMNARDRQLLTIGITTELGEVGDDTALGRATNFFLRQAQMVETINRVSTFLVAYREGIRHGMKPADASAFAEKTIEQTHGDYSKENAPSLFNENSMMRMATQFRKFQFIQTGMMFRMMRDAAKGMTPEERAIARRQLAWMLMTHLAMAGVKGLPAANLVLGAVAFCFGAPGDDDEDLIRRAIKDKETSDLLLKGLPTLMGLDLSRKVGAGEMLSPLPFWNYDPSQGKRNATELIANAAGPWASLASRTWEAQKFFLQGDYMKALEQVLPYGLFSNGVKAMRLGTQGYTNNTGDVLIDPKDFSAWDIFGTSMGLTTSTMGDRSRLQGSVLNHDNAFNAHKSRLQRDFNYAKKTHDYKGMAAAVKALGDLNIEMRKVGYKPFKANTLQSGAKQQTKREQNARGGVATTERNRRYTQLGSQW